VTLQLEPPSAENVTSQHALKNWFSELLPSAAPF